MGGNLTKIRYIKKQRELVVALQSAIRGNNIEKVNELLNEGADVNLCPERSDPPLILAVRYNYVQCARLLIKFGADVNISDRWGETALYRAVSFEHYECIELLISAGADVNQATTYGYTPLHRACAVGSCKCIDILTAAGADVNVTDNSGRTAVYKCMMYKDRIDCALRLLEAGADVNLPDSSGNPPLFRSCFNIPCARALLLAGADVKIKNNLQQDILQYRTVNQKYYMDEGVFRDDLIRLITMFKTAEGLRNKSFNDTNNEDEFCLMRLCRKTIRQELSNRKQDLNVLSGFMGLGLPASMVSYLLYDVISSDAITFLLRVAEESSESEDRAQISEV